ncbi:hypothetical protein N7520_009173 [Penicillium odoratum]|uniref:uncharacterized protein n=1 Tax=Penicillium odoratum TaxID=1167516 RepID=UPI0025492211|nr:uncharacterized protein N7520_009173 [Penicillium odoratum]KAJ5752256.1 hypothetical protein N7520_009173 [Penicillium odoratum]
MASADRPQILFVSLAYLEFFDQTYGPLMTRLLEVSRVKRAKTAAGALRALADNTFKAIIIADSGLIADDYDIKSTPETDELLNKIKTYIEGGGLAIVGLHFPNFTNSNQFNTFFERFGLPWKRGDYHRTTFQHTSSGILPEGVQSASLPGPYSMKVLHVDNARPQEKIFVPVAGAKTQSLVFSPEYVDETQAAVVGAKIGKGNMVYCGDVNGESESNALMLALCGF